MTRSPQMTHKELLTTLLELYNIFEDLAILRPDEKFILPPTNSGVYPAELFNAEAASAAGYNDEAVSVLASLPCMPAQIAIEPSTRAECYLGTDMNVEHFQWRRELLEWALEEDGPITMPPTAISLTHDVDQYGYTYIYDVETKLVTRFEGMWHHEEGYDPISYSDVAHYPAKPPSEAFKPLIEHYRKLDYIGNPWDNFERVEHQHETDGGFGRHGREGPPDWQRDVSQNLRRMHRASYDTWAAFRQIKGIYIECGWDIDAVEQTKFRREEFIDRRARHWFEIVEPLRLVEELLRDDIVREEHANSWKDNRDGAKSVAHGHGEEIFGRPQCIQKWYDIVAARRA